ncbi:14131_t:CDS:1, partial [Dentiscutata erythropus]
NTPLKEIGCNSTNLMELRAKKRQQQLTSTCKQNLDQENFKDDE